MVPLIWARWVISGRAHTLVFKLWLHGLGEKWSDETRPTDIPTENFLQGLRFVDSKNIYNYTEVWGKQALRFFEYERNGSFCLVLDQCPMALYRGVCRCPDEFLGFASPGVTLFGLQKLLTLN